LHPAQRRRTTASTLNVQALDNDAPMIRSIGRVDRTATAKASASACTRGSGTRLSPRPRAVPKDPSRPVRHVEQCKQSNRVRHRVTSVGDDDERHAHSARQVRLDGRPAQLTAPGERSRATLAKLMAVGTNCLVLDELTNDLDLPTIEELEQAPDTFGGTVLVTHDRAQPAQHRWSFQSGRRAWQLGHISSSIPAHNASDMWHG
jgi:hypothetical protein